MFVFVMLEEHPMVRGHDKVVFSRRTVRSRNPPTPARSDQAPFQNTTWRPNGSFFRTTSSRVFASSGSSCTIRVIELPFLDGQFKHGVQCTVRRFP